MAIKLQDPTKSGGTTNHHEEIKGLRATAKVHEENGLLTTAVIYKAAASLLEVHDDSGISLENFGAVGDLVNFALRDLGFDPYIPNGV